MSFGFLRAFFQPVDPDGPRVKSILDLPNTASQDIMICEIVTEASFPICYTVSKEQKELICMKLKKWLIPSLFTLGGALAGLGYHYLVGCDAGNCLVYSSPITSMLYMGLIGWLLSGIFVKRCNTCNT
jgi:hypothetical protein